MSSPSLRIGERGDGGNDPETSAKFQTARASTPPCRSPTALSCRMALDQWLSSAKAARQVAKSIRDGAARRSWPGLINLLGAVLLVDADPASTISQGDRGCEPQTSDLTCWAQSCSGPSLARQGTTGIPKQILQRPPSSSAANAGKSLARSWWKQQRREPAGRRGRGRGLEVSGAGRNDILELVA